MGVAYKSALEPVVDTGTDLVQFLNDVADIEKVYGVKLLSSEAKLLRLIKNEPGHYLKHYLIKSGLSIRWFSVTVDQLVSSGMVVKEKCHVDVRARRLS